jgi:hypothetical protein
MCFIEAFGAVEGVKPDKIEGEESSSEEVIREIDFLTRSRIVRTSPVPVATFFAARSSATLSIKGKLFGKGVEAEVVVRTAGVDDESACSKVIG